MKFVTETKVRFAHVDPAGIVFFPRYFELLNGAVEDWFDSLGFSFRLMHLDRKIAVPTVSLQCEFVAPGMLGDHLQIELTVQKLGRSSLNYNFRFEMNGSERVRGSAVLVCTDPVAQRSMPWPADLRASLERERPQD